MTTYSYTTPRSTLSDWTNSDSDHWSDIITTPTPSLLASPLSHLKNPSGHKLEHDPISKYKYTFQQRFDKMEESWKDYPLPASPLTDLSSGIAPHGLGGHRRGPSELESTVLWDTSQTNGELGLAPHIQMEADMKAGFPGSSNIPITSSSGRKMSTSTTNSNSIGGQLPLPIAVWATIMDSSKGRDKVLVRSFTSLNHQLTFRNAFNIHYERTYISYQSLLQSDHSHLGYDPTTNE